MNLYKVETSALCYVDNNYSGRERDDFNMLAKNLDSAISKSMRKIQKKYKPHGRKEKFTYKKYEVISCELYIENISA